MGKKIAGGLFERARRLVYCKTNLLCLFMSMLMLPQYSVWQCSVSQ